MDSSAADDTEMCDLCSNRHPRMHVCLNTQEAAEGYKPIYGWVIDYSDCTVVQAERQVKHRAYLAKQHMIESYNYVVFMVKLNKGTLAWTNSMSNYYNRRNKCHDNTDMERLTSDLLYKAETNGKKSQLFTSAPEEVRSAVLKHLKLKAEL